MASSLEPYKGGYSVCIVILHFGSDQVKSSARDKIFVNSALTCPGFPIPVIV
jgi:hypothetical protein